MINQVLDLWEKICEDACEIGGGHLLSAMPGADKGDRHGIDIAGIKYETAEKIKKILKYEKTSFLVFAVIKRALNILENIYLITMYEAMYETKKFEAKLDRIKNLHKLLDAAPGQKEWKFYLERIMNFSDGFKSKPELETVKAISNVSDLLIDAMTVPETWNTIKIQGGDP